MKIVLIGLVIVYLVKSDLPIDCLNSQIVGEWDFELTKAQQFTLPMDNICGHQQPDNEQTSNIAMQGNFSKDSSLKLYLAENGEIRSQADMDQVVVGKRMHQQSKFNFWTMIYDEGFEIQYEQYNIFVYNYYTLDVSDQKSKSHCSKTTVGWYRNKNNNHYGCIRGQKVSKPMIRKELGQENEKEKEKEKEFKRFRKNKKEYQIKMIRSRRKLGQMIKMRFKQKLQSMFKTRIRMDSNFSDHQIVIDRINAYNRLKGKKWKAKMNSMVANSTIHQLKSKSRRKLHKVKRTKKQELPSLKTQLIGMLAMQDDLQDKEDRMLKKQKDLDYVEDDPYYRNNFKSFKEYQKLNKKVDAYLQELDKKQHYDWGKQIGYDSRVYSQGNCGACYAISTLGMIDFRLRIQHYNKSKQAEEDKTRFKKDARKKDSRNRFRFRLKKFIFKTVNKDEKGKNNHPKNQNDSQNDNQNDNQNSNQNSNRNDNWNNNQNNDKSEVKKQLKNDESKKEEDKKNISDVEIDMDPNEMENLSPQYVLDCNSYTQGCDGGFAELVSRFAEENFLIGETFKPYNDGTQKCRDLRNIGELRWGVRVRNHGYVGGRYGNGDHFNMIKEIEKNGPVVASLLLDDSFYYYDEGIYEPIDEQDWKQMNIDRPIYEEVTHSVLVYGWGESEDKRYWIIQNSWGDSWGEHGSFRMIRGLDSQGIESQPEYAVPYVIQVTSDIYD